MRVCFLDASALVKRYLQETGSEWVQTICQDRKVSLVIASLTWVEVASAISRKARARDLPRAGGRLKLAELERHVRREYVRIHLRLPVLAESVRLMTRHPLKASDAIQLASALAVRRAARTVRSEFSFVSADARLLEAARRDGLSTDNPTDLS